MHGNFTLDLRHYGSYLPASRPDRGAKVARAKLVLTIGNNDHMRVDAAVDLGVAVHLHVGMPVRVMLDSTASHPLNGIAGHITHVAELANPASGCLVSISIALDAPQVLDAVGG